ncbi:MAG: 16S rRNA (cytidine(1402)-2'-O)-methyltransferase, partial [Dehalococcoidia bacterium]|nr:16S rRNA (cytidine(1402)-2'-O)-methyltransferase [Dehalococcoidia bacterium]
RRKILESVADRPGTIIILEAPHRLPATLKDMLVSLGDRRIAVCRELTKIHEEVFRGKISQAIEHFTQPRGEFTLVIEGNTGVNKAPLTEAIEQELNQMRLAGVTAKEAIAKVAVETGLSRKELYRAWLN